MKKSRKRSKTVVFGQFYFLGAVLRRISNSPKQFLVKLYLKACVMGCQLAEGGAQSVGFSLVGKVFTNFQFRGPSVNFADDYVCNHVFLGTARVKENADVGVPFLAVQYRRKTVDRQM